ncbi:LBP/BPI/CETP family protein [Gymnodinialimonas sp.]
MDPVLSILNTVISENLGKINSAITNGIKQQHLDPMARVASGTADAGSINLGIGHAGASAHYELTNMKGLSSLTIHTLQITNGGADPNDASVLNGSILLNATLSSDLSIHAGGSVEAHLGFIKPEVGLSGTVTVSGVSASATGTFTAGLEGSKICLNKARLNQLSINYTGAKVDIDGLGVFNVLLHPIESLILDAAKGAIRGAVVQAVTPVINGEVNSVLPICGSVT